ncbi:redox-regulated ATPase YchF [Candidatus Saccharibacteria bacterium]|nr:redox-regulated ATPase YchF [Candidatus Saccharibacteria bacterium]
MMLSIGIVGLPNVGKSTLFNALTKNRVLAANYPFATIEPNTGVVNVPDERIYTLAKISQSTKVIPAAVTFVDIAGIVRGASKGEGLGNKFLSHIRESNVITQVVRAFENDDIVHVEGKIDPERDIEIIRTELCLADLASVTKKLETLQKELKSNPKIIGDIQTLEEAKKILDSNSLLSRHPELDSGSRTKQIPDRAWDDKWAVLADLQLLTIKPFMYVFNIDEATLSNSSKQAELAKLVEGSKCIFLCAQIETELQDMPEEDAKELLESLGQSESGLETLIRLGYQTLGYISYFTTGPVESRAWTIPAGATAPQAAGVIHTDFEKGFIKAEVVDYSSFVSGSGWAGAGTAGKVRLEGKDYIMQDGDIVVFRHNV